MTQSVFLTLEDKGLVDSVCNIRKHSRNTHVAFANVGGKPAVLKYNSHLIGDEGVKAVRAQSEVINSFLGEDRYHIAGILRHWPDHGVVALERCKYPSVTEHLLAPSPDLSFLGRVLGSAMRLVHDRSTLSRPDQGIFLLHCDFSPANLLVDVESADFCIIDMPDRKVLGRCECDLGIALFEIVRTLLKSKKAMGALTAFRLRYELLAGYTQNQKASSSHSLLLTYAYEYVHAFRVMRRYVNFWRYQDSGRQFLRMLLLFPATLVLTILFLPLLQIIHWVRGALFNRR